MLIQGIERNKTIVCDSKVIAIHFLKMVVIEHCIMQLRTLYCAVKFKYSKKKSVLKIFFLFVIKLYFVLYPTTTLFLGVYRLSNRLFINSYKAIMSKIWSVCRVRLANTIPYALVRYRVYKT